MDHRLGLFLGVIVFLAFIQWAWGRRSRGKKEAGSSNYDGTWTDNSVPASHHGDFSCHGASSDAGGSSDSCSSDDGGGSDGGGGGDSGSF